MTSDSTQSTDQDKRKVHCSLVLHDFIVGLVEFLHLY